MTKPNLLIMLTVSVSSKCSPVIIDRYINR